MRPTSIRARAEILATLVASLLLGCDAAPPPSASSAMAEEPSPVTAPTEPTEAPAETPAVLPVVAPQPPVVASQPAVVASQPPVDAAPAEGVATGALARGAALVRGVDVKIPSMDELFAARPDEPGAIADAPALPKGPPSGGDAPPSSDVPATPKAEPATPKSHVDPTPTDAKPTKGVTGIAACDEFVARYAECIAEHVPDTAKAPMWDALRRMAKELKASVKHNPTAAAKGCSTAVSVLAKELAPLGCTFDGPVKPIEWPKAPKLPTGTTGLEACDAYVARAVACVAKLPADQREDETRFIAGYFDTTRRGVEQGAGNEAVLDTFAQACLATHQEMRRSKRHAAHGCTW